MTRCSWASLVRVVSVGDWGWYSGRTEVPSRTIKRTQWKAGSKRRYFSIRTRQNPDSKLSPVSVGAVTILSAAVRQATNWHWQQQLNGWTTCSVSAGFCSVNDTVRRTAGLKSVGAAYGRTGPGSDSRRPTDWGEGCAGRRISLIVSTTPTVTAILLDFGFSYIQRDRKVTMQRRIDGHLDFHRLAECHRHWLEVLRMTQSSTDYRPWASLWPPGILPHGHFWVPWPSKYTVQVVCKWAVAVCVCGAGSNKCTIWNSKLRWPCLLATHLLWQKRPFPYIVLLFEQFNML